MTSNSREVELLRAENQRLLQERENLLRQLQSSENNSLLTQKLQSEVMQLTALKNQLEERIALLTVENERLSQKIQYIQNEQKNLLLKTENSYIEKLKNLEDEYNRRVNQTRISIHQENESQNSMLIGNY